MDAPSFSHLSDQNLANEVRRLATCERRATADLLASLAEFDGRRLFLAAGFTSLFTYCTQQLCLSEGAAYRRIEAARICRRFPSAFGLLAEGAITLTSLALLAPHLTETNHADLFARAAHKSKRKVEIIAAELNPRPDAPDALRRLPRRRPAAARHAGPPAALADLLPSLSPPADAGSDEEAGPALPPPTWPRPTVAPLTPERFRLQVTLSRETHDLLREVQDLIRHALPRADLETIFDRALALLRDQLLRQKAGLVLRPRSGTARTTMRSRHISARVRRRVWTRDEARCAFVGSQGRCEMRAFLEFHHVKPYAVGGSNEADNIELRCRAHNGHEADIFAGAGA